MQLAFCCIIEKGSLAARPNIGHTYQTFSIITERVAEAEEIDSDDPASMPSLDDDAEICQPLSEVYECI